MMRCCWRVAVLLSTSFIAACSEGVLDPHGPIGVAERTILIDATLIMCAVVIPVILATLAFAWWFRSGNRRAIRLPNWSYSGRIEFIIWSIPALVVLFLGGIAWEGSHLLDPRAPLASPTPPLDIEVVSLDWKWLFIYPAQGIASVNRLVVPAGTPLRFRLTSASVMNSFFIPQLGTQIYTMSGMTSRLNLQADQPGTYKGLSAQFSGDGFSDMRFDVSAISAGEFDAWAQNARSAGRTLDGDAYAALVKPSERDTPATFGSVQDNIFESIATVSPLAKAPL